MMNTPIPPPPPYGTSLRLVETPRIVRVDQIQIIFPESLDLERRWHFRDGATLWVPAGRDVVSVPPAAIACEWKLPSDPRAQSETICDRLLRRANYGRYWPKLVV